MILKKLKACKYSNGYLNTHLQLIFLPKADQTLVEIFLGQKPCWKILVKRSKNNY
ncbi:MAG: hypothetical protein ACD_8C00067G0014 [uncultured bacterium]|nr:MAG: hypothetical protein ACD_8C00067G0014 [uncultured bacterium]